MRTEMLAGVAFCVASLISPMARAYDAIVRTETFELAGDFTTINNGKIKNVKIGYETYGTLSANKDKRDTLMPRLHQHQTLRWQI